MYDPVTRRVISPDNYIQAPDNTQSFNRYSYCFNNPLKYTDPSGDLIFVPILIAAAIGGVVNVDIQSLNGNIDYNKSGWGWDVATAFGIGAAAGAVSVAVPQAMGTFMGYGLTTATGGLASGFVPGAIAGVSGGFVGSFGNSMYFDYNPSASFGNNLWNATVSGLKGAVIGGVGGGLIGGTIAKISGNPFWGTKVENMPWYTQVPTKGKDGVYDWDKLRWRHIYDPANGFKQISVMKNAPDGTINDQIDIWAKDITNPKSTPNFLVGDKTRTEEWNWWTGGNSSPNGISYPLPGGQYNGVLTNGSSTGGPTIIFQQMGSSGKFIPYLKLRW
jgi:hypothetical protein